MGTNSSLSEVIPGPYYLRDERIYEGVIIGVLRDYQSSVVHLEK